MFIWALLPVKCDKNKENSNEYKLPLDGIQMNLESELEDLALLDLEK